MNGDNSNNNGVDAGNNGPGNAAGNGHGDDAHGRQSRGSARRTFSSVNSTIGFEMRSLGRKATRGTWNTGAAANKDRKQHQSQSQGDQLEIPESIAFATDRELEIDVRRFASEDLGLEEKKVDQFVRAATVAKHSRVYELVARGHEDYPDRSLAVTLTQIEKDALVRERDRLFSESGILIVSISVAIAAFLQGHVQSSVNGSASFPYQLGITPDRGDSLMANNELNAHQYCISKNTTYIDSGTQEIDQWRLGALNAMPFLSSAFLGVWLSMPVNNHFGRRGAMMVAAVLVFVTSLLSGLVVLFDPQHRWMALMIIRIGSGLGMGIKAVSSPILASETAIRFWRGSFTLGWQLWVAFGIMGGFLFNLIFVVATDEPQSELTVALILAAPMVPSLILFFILIFCPESPRYYMRQGSPKYSPKKAFEIFSKLRSCELLAMKDMYVLYKTVEEEYANIRSDRANDNNDIKENDVALGFFSQLKDLFTKRRLRNALISSGTVNLAQPLSGINFMALFSGPFFTNIFSASARSSEGANCNWDLLPKIMGVSLGFGVVNFLFGLPAFKTIDSLGRRKWLIATLPLMAMFLLLAGLSMPINNGNGGISPPQGEGLALGPGGQIVQGKLVDMTTRLVIMYLYLHCATYSPGMGPIPFTLASESFPLSHREMGCAFCVAICYGTMGLLFILYPWFVYSIGPSGSLFIFAGVCLVAWVLVFIFVEETKELSLESLDVIFGYPKTRFVRYQIFDYLPWLFKRYIIRERPEPPRPTLRVVNPREPLSEFSGVSGVEHPPGRDGRDGDDYDGQYTDDVSSMSSGSSDDE